jgi:hypothetical protein
MQIAEKVACSTIFPFSSPLVVEDPVFIGREKLNLSLSFSSPLVGEELKVRGLRINQIIIHCPV